MQRYRPWCVCLQFGEPGDRASDQSQSVPVSMYARTSKYWRRWGSHCRVADLSTIGHAAAGSQRYTSMYQVQGWWRLGGRAVVPISIPLRSRRHPQSTGGTQTPVGGLEHNPRDVLMGTFNFLPENGEIQGLASVQNRCECNSIRCYTRQQRKKAHILSLVADGSRLQRVKWVDILSSAWCCMRFLAACHAYPSSWMPCFQWQG
jgi:hypothetical protein